MSSFKVGDRIRLHTSPPYLKSADPMPMLRPPDLVPVGAEGSIISKRPGGYLGVKFDQGSFLVDAQYIEPIKNVTDTPSETP